MLFQILTLLFIVASLALVLVILVQRPQGGGLAQAFGGASGGGSDTAFGGRTGDVLTYLTMGAFAVYLAIAIGLNMVDPTSAPAQDATEEAVIEPGLLPPVDAQGNVQLQPVAPPTPGPEPVRTVDQPLTAPPPAVDPAASAPAPAPAPEPAPAPAPAPAGGNP